LESELNQTKVGLEQVEEKIVLEDDNHNNVQDNFIMEIKSLKYTVDVLEQKLLEEQRKHTQEMEEFSNSLNGKLKKLEATQRKTIN
jgi:hypothetical protein